MCKMKEMVLCFVCMLVVLGKELPPPSEGCIGIQSKLLAISLILIQNKIMLSCNCQMVSCRTLYSILLMHVIIIFLSFYSTIIHAEVSCLVRD